MKISARSRYSENKKFAVSLKRTNVRISPIIMTLPMNLVSTDPFSEVYSLLLMQSLVQLSRYIHTVLMDVYLFKLVNYCERRACLIAYRNK